MTGSPNNSVNANPDLAPPGWWHDEMFAEEVRRKIRAMNREDYSVLEIARRTGVSSRSVTRILARSRETREPVFCGAPTMSPRLGSRACTQAVSVEGQRCVWHR